jgi:ABC-2 type transport system permease protein
MDAPRHPPARPTAVPRVQPDTSDGTQHPQLPAAPHFLAPTARPLGKAGPSGGFRRSRGPRSLPRLLNRAAIVFVWEIKTFFFRPASYLLLLAAALVAGWSFSWLVTLLSRGPDAALRRVDDPLLQYLGPNIFLLGGCTLLVPLLTMNAIADERRRASWELLMTAPISPIAVVLGKFAANWSLFMTCLAPWLYYLVVLRFWNGKTRFLWSVLPWPDGAGLEFDWGPAWGACIGLATVGATFVASGMFCSGLCRGPASAALLSLVTMGAILVAGFVPRILEYWGYSQEQVRILETVSCWGHFERFSQGVIEPRIIVAHVSICAVLLWGTVHFSRRVDGA